MQTENQTTGLFKKEHTKNEQTELRRAAVGRERQAYPNLSPGTFIKVG
jgi:hypothetical protein